jgi:hypothetical protein
MDFRFDIADGTIYGTLKQFETMMTEKDRHLKLVTTELEVERTKHRELEEQRQRDLVEQQQRETLVEQKCQEVLERERQQELVEQKRQGVLAEQQRQAELAEQKHQQELSERKKQEALAEQKHHEQALEWQHQQQLAEQKQQEALRHAELAEQQVQELVERPQLAEKRGEVASSSLNLQTSQIDVSMDLELVTGQEAAGDVPMDEENPGVMTARRAERANQRYMDVSSDEEVVSNHNLSDVYDNVR